VSFYQLFGTDKDAEKEGIWIDYGEAGRIKIARAGGSNDAYNKALANFLKANKHQIDTETMPDEVAEAKMRELFAKHVVKDWDGVKDAKGKTLPYSTENVVTLLTDLKDLYRDLSAQAAKISNFRAAELEADAKN
jgi:hypothetical protein